MVILPTLRQLQFFVALARRQSFSRAAEDCLVSQSTLSSAIKELEGLLDVQLVDRSTRSFSLTPAGKTVAVRGAEILAQTEDLATAVRDRELLSGPFNLGVIPTIAPFLLPALTPILKHERPSLQLYLREDLTAMLVTQMTAGQIDAAILALPYDMPGTEVEQIGHDEFWFACDPQHVLAKESEISLDQLSKTGLMLLEDGHCLRDHAIEACHLRSGDQSAAYGATSLLTLAEMTRAGLGATLLPDMAVRQGMARAAGLVTRPLQAPVPARDIGLVWRRGSGRTDDARALAAHTRTALEKLQSAVLKP